MTTQSRSGLAHAAIIGATAVAIVGGLLFSMAEAVASQNAETSAASTADDWWAVLGFAVASVGMFAAIFALRARDRDYPCRLRRDGHTWCVPRHRAGLVMLGLFGGTGVLGVALLVLFPLLSTNRPLAGPVLVGTLFVLIGLAPFTLFATGRLVPRHLEIDRTTVRWLDPRAKVVRSIARDTIASVVVESNQAATAIPIRVPVMHALRFLDRDGNEVETWPGAYGEPVVVARALARNGIPAVLQPPRPSTRGRPTRPLARDTSPAPSADDRR